MRATWWVSALSVVVLGACSQAGASDDEGAVCTARGSLSGVGVSIEADVAPVRGLRLRTCIDGTCRTDLVALEDGTSAGEESCSGTGDDANCSVELTPDGTQYGFVALDLPEGPVQMSGTYRAGGQAPAVRLAPVMVVAEVTYPNGPDCGAGGVQAHVTVGPDGID